MQIVKYIHMYIHNGNPVPVQLFICLCLITSINQLLINLSYSEKYSLVSLGIRISKAVFLMKEMSASC